ncbi:MAG: helix-turn-helix domain-containing protein [Candidatus Dormibacteria bacterium]|jgi:transcriptional regulator with XRE-family HTH domain
MGKSLRVTSVSDLGRVVLASRKQHGWTQAELAGRAAVGRSAVQKLEAAWGTVNLDTALRILTVLSLDLAVVERAGGVMPEDLVP